MSSRQSVTRFLQTLFYFYVFQQSPQQLAPICRAACAGISRSMFWADARETPWTGKQSITAVHILLPSNILRRTPATGSDFAFCVIPLRRWDRANSWCLFSYFAKLFNTVLSILSGCMAGGIVTAPTGLIEVTPNALSALCLRCQPELPKINCHAMWQDRKMSVRVGPRALLKGNKCSIAQMYCGFGCFPSSDTGSVVGSSQPGV